MRLGLALDLSRTLGATASGWTPSDLGGKLLGAWDAERTDLISLSGSQVTSWKDYVAGYDVTQGVGGARPLYSATSFNGRPGLTFDGADDVLVMASQPFPAADSECEMWAILDQVTPATTTGSLGVISYSGSSTTTGRSLRRTAVSGVNRGSIGSADGAAASVVSQETVDFSGIHVLRGKWGATRWAEVDEARSAASSFTEATGTTRTAIGALSNASPINFLNMILSAVFVTAPLASDEAAEMYTYLNARGGI